MNTEKTILKALNKLGMVDHLKIVSDPLRPDKEYWIKNPELAKELSKKVDKMYARSRKTERTK